MADSMDTADLLGKAPASPGVPRAPRSPGAPEHAALADSASPAVREDSALAEPPDVLLARKALVPQAKRNLAAAFGDEACGSWGGGPWMRPPSPGGSPPPLVLSPRPPRPVQLTDLSSAVKREKKKAGLRLERTFSGYLPRAEEVVAQEVVAQDVDPETLFELSDLPALRSCPGSSVRPASPKRQCRLEMDIKALSPLKGMHIDFDELQMYDCV